ncbi:MAG TPA: RCC1 domain-containing protein [Polyangiaceae bacterium]|nr:RCC1 domain-containing protein [Polyangiaceae bacterium]
MTWRHVAAGETHTCAIAANEKVYCTTSDVWALADNTLLATSLSDDGTIWARA